ncbi:hypothetical protein XaC1_168 [Xanthomonas phage XaC1]|nr:hypothetical protein XaC1_168 [Xanthomonas phage XaC1]
MKFKEVLHILHKIKKNGKSYFRNSYDEDDTIFPRGYSLVNQNSLGPRKFYLEILESHSSGFIITNKYIKYLNKDTVAFDSTTMNDEDYFNLMLIKPDILSLDEVKYIQKYARSFKPKFYYVTYTFLMGQKFCDLLKQEY